MLVVLSMVMVLVTSIVVGSTVSLRNQQVSSDRDTGLKYAQQGMEIVRSLRDRSWESFAVYTGSYCLDETSTFTPLVDTCTTLLDDVYERVVTFTWDADNQRMGVTMVVSWNLGATPYSTTLDTYYTNWK